MSDYLIPLKKNMQFLYSLYMYSCNLTLWEFWTKLIIKKITAVFLNPVVTEIHTEIHMKLIEQKMKSWMNNILFDWSFSSKTYESEDSNIFFLNSLQFIVHKIWNSKKNLQLGINSSYFTSCTNSIKSTNSFPVTLVTSCKNIIS